MCEGEGLRLINHFPTFAELQVLAEGLVEPGQVLLVLSDLPDDIHALLNDSLANELKNPVPSEGFTGDIEGQVLGVDDTLNEVEVFRDEVFTAIHDEDTADVVLDVVALHL